MRVLMVSPFPPLRDGVGKYAAQEVAALRAEGHEVEVLAPVACAAHYVEDFKAGGLGLVRLRRFARRYDRVILQYQPAHYHNSGSGPSRILSNLRMWLAFLTIRNLTVVCHEVEYPPASWSRWRPERMLERWAWRAAREVDFHTQHEVEAMRRQLGVVPKRAVIRPHGRYFKAAVSEGRPEARSKLGLDPDEPILLCIGFIQPHKGFDRAIRAFRRLPGKASLVVVGSIRADTREHRAYLEELEELASGDARVEVRETMLSDEEFDRWIVAADAVVLPYREIWTSGVLERARVLDRRVIATMTGGMGEQIQPPDVLVSDDDELARAMAEVVGAGLPSPVATMSVAEAAAHVEQESARRKEAAVGRAGVDRALQLLGRSWGVRSVILPSQRPVIGRLLDLVKRVGRRALGWLFVPILGQINEFERLTLEAFKAVISEVRGSDPSEYAVFDYPEFEKQFRGTSETLKEAQREYVTEFKGYEPVLDVGCGRGEFLELLREADIEARGVDLSLEMVMAARKKNLNVDQGDGVAYLKRLRPGSLGGVFASQVIEHMPPRALMEFLRGARRALRPGGVLVCETVNPQSLYALANWFYMDLTHAQPVHPQTLRFLADQVGFVDIEIRYLSPAKPDREALPSDPDAPAWAHRLTKSVDDELRALDETVFGPQDYAMIARVP